MLDMIVVFKENWRRIILLIDLIGPWGVEEYPWLLAKFASENQSTSFTTGLMVSTGFPERFRILSGCSS